MEKWLDIYEFPGYWVSDQGRVKSEERNKILAIVRNQGGVSIVGMSRDGVQHKRGVARLVAERFLPHSTQDDFNVPIHLDGDRRNNCADNLAWRPEWFAKIHARQWVNRGARVPRPIVDVVSGEEFANSTEAALSYGLLEKDIFASIHDGVKVYPTYQRFEILQ